MKKKKILVLIASLTLILTAVISSTAAYLISRPEPVENIFTPGKVDNEIEEKFDQLVKQNVRVQNTGNVDAYIRARVVVTWQDDTGVVAPVLPVENTDYNIAFGRSNWVKDTDGVYYYTEVVAPGEYTDDLVERCEPRQDKEGYHLVVEILSQAVQAAPYTDYKAAWNAAQN